MTKFKKLLSLLLALCLIGSVSFAAFAEELDEDKIEVDTENNTVVVDMTHLDVKANAKYYAEIDGEKVELDAALDPNTIVVTVSAPDANFVYDYSNYTVYTLVEDGMTEYRIVLDGTDGAALNLIDWAGASFYMRNVYVSARFVFEDVPEVLKDHMEQTEDGKYYVDVVNYNYTGMQECTSHNGLRSEGNHGVISGVDLYLGVSGMSVETPVPETTVPETTVPETTVPETTVPETTVPETTVPETTVPETTVPETTVPETTVPAETEPAPSIPTDDVPETGDDNMTMLMVLLAVSFVGMVATLVIGNKLRYTGKWEG